MAQALDVSHYSGSIDWVKVKASGVKLAWTKATEGLSLLDACLARNLQGMRQNGIHDGTYHFARPAEDARQQADWYVDSVMRAGGFGALEPVLDIEDAGGLNVAQLTAWMDTWLQRVEQRTGKRPVIYCSPYFANTHFNGKRFTRYGLWVADYGPSQPALPVGWSKWAYWQYSDKGRVDGISGDVDMDYIEGEVPTVAQTYTQGSSGDGVKTLQEELKQVLGLGSSFATDGRYGPATAAAVKSFQLQYKLTVDGIAGPQTLSALSAAVKKLDAPKDAPTAKPATPNETETKTAPTTNPPVDTTEIQSKVAQVASLLSQAEAILKTI